VGNSGCDCHDLLSASLAMTKRVKLLAMTKIRETPCNDGGEKQEENSLGSGLNI